MAFAGHPSYIVKRSNETQTEMARNRYDIYMPDMDSNGYVLAGSIELDADFVLDESPCEDIFALAQHGVRDEQEEFGYNWVRTAVALHGMTSDRADGKGITSMSSGAYLMVYRAGENSCRACFLCMSIGWKSIQTQPSTCSRGVVTDISGNQIDLWNNSPVIAG